MLERGSSHTSKIPLPVDHILLHLIAHNTCRGLASNKSVLRLMANFTAVQVPLLHPDLATTCDITVIRPTDWTMPLCLRPTQLQMFLPHPGWIDALPFPKIRDNLIRRQHSFDHIRFLEDLVGDSVHLLPPSVPEQDGHMLFPDPGSNDMGHDNQTTHDPRGLILWGEPYLKESWEATPGFLGKWAWTMEGCDELVKISNGWRISRGEDPLVVPCC